MLRPCARRAGGGAGGGTTRLFCPLLALACSLTIFTPSGGSPQAKTATTLMLLFLLHPPLPSLAALFCLVLTSHRLAAAGGRLGASGGAAVGRSALRLQAAAGLLAALVQVIVVTRKSDYVLQQPGKAVASVMVILSLVGSCARRGCMAPALPPGRSRLLCLPPAPLPTPPLACPTITNRSSLWRPCAPRHPTTRRCVARLPW